MNKQLLFNRTFGKVDFIQQLLQSRNLNAFVLILFIALFFSTSHAQDCTPSLEWQRSIGGDTTDQAGSIINTSDGGYMIAGYTSSNNGDVSGNHGQQDFWLVKLASDNSIMWQEPLGGGHEDIGHAVVEATDGGYVIAGSTRSDNGNVTNNHGIHDFWVVKLDVNGNIIWQNSLGGSQNDFAYAISTTSDGGYIVAGSTSSNDFDVSGNHELYDYWVVKLDADGIMQWQKTLGGTHSDEAYSVKQTTDGGYIVAGYTASTDGDVTSNHGITDYWVVKLDESGNLSWQKSLGGPASDIANSVQLTSDGGYIVAGSASSNSGDVNGNHGFSDYWVVKLDSAGTLVWQKALGGSNYDDGNAIEQTSDGGYITIGKSRSNDDNVTGWHGGSDIWIAKQDANGVLVWEKSLGGTFDEGGYSIEQTPDNGFIIAGYSSSNDGDVSGNHGFEDFWVVKLTSDVSPANTFYVDADGDSYGDPLISIDTVACNPPAGYVIDNTDCNDANASIHPGASEVCNGLDDNCNIAVDEGLPTNTYYADVDNDTYGNPYTSVNACQPLVGFVSNSLDCDDTNASIHPGGTEICNDLDDDCNGTPDDGLPTNIYYMDGDGDTYGNSVVMTNDCSQPNGYVTDSTDCDDTNPNVNPGVIEVSNNGIDDNCNGQTDEFGVGISAININSSFNIFPNPASDVIILEMQMSSSGNAIISITNVLGEALFEKALPFKNGMLREEISLDKKFSEGMYYVRVRCDQQQWVKPFVLTR